MKFLKSEKKYESYVENWNKKVNKYYKKIKQLFRMIYLKIRKRISRISL